MSATRDDRGAVPAIILAGYAMAVLDVSIVMVALPTIDHDLGSRRRGCRGCTTPTR